MFSRSKYLVRKFSTSHSNNSLVTYEMISTNKDIGLITIKNSKKRNALSLSILDSLNESLNTIEKDFTSKKIPRVVIICSEGGVFSSGHDLKELYSFSQDQKDKTFEACSNLMMSIQKSSSIIIAEVQGLATAAGCQLAASCDLVVASDKAKFETPGVKIGLFCSSPSVALARAVSHKRAMQMLVTGEPISASKAYDWGLVNEIVEVGNEEEEKQREKLRVGTLKLAEQINNFSGETLSFGKRIYYSQTGQTNLQSAYEIAGKAMCTNLCFADTQEGISAFLQKRKPKFNSNDNKH
jgi:enoyl-CoA hydratase/carnithine racemase